MRKHYLALITGNLQPAEQRVDASIDRHASVKCALDCIAPDCWSSCKPPVLATRAWVQAALLQQA